MYDVNKYKCYAYEEKRPDGTKCPVCVAISTYAGRTVKGYAKLNPHDEFNWEKGRDLAIARCNAKIASKRAKRAESKVEEAKMFVDEALAYLADMTQYQVDACAEVAEASNYLKTLLEKM